MIKGLEYFTFCLNYIKMSDMKSVTVNSRKVIKTCLLYYIKIFSTELRKTP